MSETNKVIEAFEKVKALVNKLRTEEKFKDVKLNDGTTIVSYDGDMPAQGMPLFVVTPEGRIPAPDGEHVTEDGTTIVVIGGLIAEAKESEVEEPATEGAAPVEAPAAVEQSAAAPKRVIKSQVEEHVFSLEIEGYEPITVDFSSMLAPYNEKFAALEKENTELKAEFAKAAEFKTEVIKLVSEIGDQPAAEATEKEANKFKKKMSLKDAQLEFRNALK
jgi:hypothetical protein